MLSYRTAGKQIPRGLDAAWDRAVAYAGRLVPRRRIFLKRADRVVALEKHFAEITDATLREQAQTFGETFRRGRHTGEDVISAFALVREVSHRQLGQRHFAVQVAGGLAIHDGCVVEMATGEGKTLTATMPATVGGWSGRGVHIVTFNDFLAKRDAEWMGPIYKFCGLRVAHIEQGMDPNDRRQAYQADITYCTNKEVAADFLRDRLALGRIKDLSSALLAKIVNGRGTARVVMRGLNYAIVDEADSILIDEAVTPLIISGEAPNPEQVEAFQQGTKLAGKLQTPQHYRVDERYREVDLTASGKQLLEELAESLGGRWGSARWREERVTQALTARQFYRHGKQYLVDDGKVVIVDEFTGRPMPDREWRDGLHQAVEAKEEITVNPPKDTYARISFQRFFRMYRKLAGMTGTAAEAWREFWQIYHLPVVVVPTNRPCVREHLPDRVLPSEQEKWRTIVEEIRRIHETGRPLLIGTRSVGASEHVSAMLSAEQLDHDVLNAVYLSKEAQITAAAGGRGHITVATNMAGRGTDIKLGRGVADLGGLHVIATERHEARRIDRQLYGRAARQGDPGSAQAIVSLEDELPRRYAPAYCKVLHRHTGQDNDGIFTRLGHALFAVAQHRAQRLALAQRKGVLRTDYWLDEYLGFAGTER